MNQILQGHPMSIFGDGEQKRAFSYVGDIADPIARAPWTPRAFQRVVNIGADVPYSVKELALEVADVLGARGHPIKYLSARNEVKIAFSDHSVAKALFGPLNNTSLNHGLAQMAKWVREVGSRKTPGFENIEITDNLPASWRE